MIELLWALIEFALNNPEWGWIIAVLIILVETRTKYGKINELQSTIVSAITVIRALARALNNDGEVDIEAIDNYLTSNGVGPDDFLISDGCLKDEKRGPPGDD